MSSKGFGLVSSLLVTGLEAARRRLSSRSVDVGLIVVCATSMRNYHVWSTSSGEVN